jgi:hypothetical protein
MENQNIGRMPKIVKDGSANYGRYAKVIDYLEASDQYRVQYKNGDIRTYKASDLLFNDKCEVGQYVIVNSENYDEAFLAVLVERDEVDRTVKVKINDFATEWVEEDDITKVLPVHKFAIPVGDYFIAKDPYRGISFTKYFTVNNEFTFRDINQFCPNLIDKAFLIQAEAGDDEE